MPGAKSCLGQGGLMLILTRKAGQSIRIGDDVEISIIEIKGKQTRIGIKAPAGLSIHREEVFQRIKRENIEAAAMPENVDAFLATGKKQ